MTAKIATEKGRLIKHVRVPARKKESFLINYPKGAVVEVIPLSPPLQKFPLVYGKKAMKFLRKGNFERTVLVISDIHLGAGTYVNGEFNTLEDFHYDTELVEFLDYYSSGDYLKQEVELVINGDLFDLLAVPFVRYFDDEFWSEEAAMEKLKLILEAIPK